MVLPQASDIKLVQIGVWRITLDDGLPLSGITSLILVQSPFQGHGALDAILSRTPWLQRFVCISRSRETTDAFRSGAEYSIGDTLDALLKHVEQSLEFLALDYPQETWAVWSQKVLINGTLDEERHDLRKFRGLRAACVPSVLLFPRPFAFDVRDLSDVLPLSLKTLAVHDVLSSLGELKAIQGIFSTAFFLLFCEYLETHIPKHVSHSSALTWRMDNTNLGIQQQK